MASGQTGGTGGINYYSADDRTYLSSLTSYNESIKYAGKNIKTSDGTVAYVTKTGLVKKYADDETYRANSGKNGCPSTIIAMNQTWQSLGFPVGSNMAKGQACGNEGSYVTTEPPENNFDAAWYRKTYPDLKLTTDAAALSDWNSAGLVAGRLPNATLMSSMAALGKVGYVDPDTMLRPITQGVDYSGGYNKYLKRSNVTGTNMIDCTTLNIIKYGDRVVLACNNLTGYLSTDSSLSFGTKKVVLIIRPLDTTSQNGTPVKFGDQVSLAVSLSNYNSTCGQWGCEVGTIDTSSLKFVFGPGGDTGGSPVQIMPTTDAFGAGDNLTYSTPFNLSAALLTPSNALYQGEYLRPASRIPSSNDQYYLIFQTDGVVAFYKQSNQEVIWKSDKTSTTPAWLRISNLGTLEAVDTGGNTYWTSGNPTGVGPFALAVQTDGELVLYDSRLKKLFSKGTSDATVANPVQTYSAKLDANNILKFSTATAGKGVFSFLNSEGSTVKASATCDVSIMQAQCGADCVGFIHDGSSNEWQQLKGKSKTTDFKMTSTVQDIYMKIPAVSLADASCKAENATFVDYTFTGNAVGGTGMSYNGAKQCSSFYASLKEKKAAYDLLELRMLEQAEKDAKAYDTSSLNNLRDSADADVLRDEIEYEKTKYSSLKENNPKTATLAKQKDDSSVINKQMQLRSILAILFTILALVLCWLTGTIWPAVVLMVLAAGWYGGMLYSAGFAFIFAIAYFKSPMWAAVTAIFIFLVYYGWMSMVSFWIYTQCSQITDCSTCITTPSPGTDPADKLKCYYNSQVNKCSAFDTGGYTGSCSPGKTGTTGTTGGYNYDPNSVNYTVGSYEGTSYDGSTYMLNILNLIKESQAYEKVLVAQLEKEMDNIAAGKAATMTEQERKDLIAKIKGEQEKRESYYALITSFRTQQAAAEAVADRAAEEQLKMTQYLESNLSVVRAALFVAEEDQRAKKKHTEINTFYGKQYEGYGRVARAVAIVASLLIVIYFLQRKFGYDAILGPVDTIVKIIGGIYILWTLYDTNMRRNDNYDEYEWPFAPGLDADLKKANAQMKAKVFDVSGIGIDIPSLCLGNYCCGPGTKWNDEKGCVSFGGSSSRYSTYSSGGTSSSTVGSSSSSSTVGSSSSSTALGTSSTSTGTGYVGLNSGSGNYSDYSGGSSGTENIGPTLTHNNTLPSTCSIGTDFNSCGRAQGNCYWCSQAMSGKGGCYDANDSKTCPDYTASKGGCIRSDCQRARSTGAPRAIPGATGGTGGTGGTGATGGTA